MARDNTPSIDSPTLPCSVSDERRDRFRMLCGSDNLCELPRERCGINVYGEKRMHTVLKHFYCPDPACHEIKPAACGQTKEQTPALPRRVTDRLVADVLTREGEIIEIQTGSLRPLTQKIHYYLCATDYRVTVVHPVVATRWLRWMDPDSGEVSARRRSPRRGQLLDVARELYYIAPFLAEPRFCLRVPLLEAEEIRLKNGWSRDGKRGSERYSYVPLSLLGEAVLDSPQQYADCFLPSEEQLPSPFTAAEYARASGIRGRATYGLLQILCDLCYLTPAARRGRAGTWERLNPDTKIIRY